MHYNCLNEAINGKMSITPTAGMLGTMFVGTDRYTVVCAHVYSPKNVFVLKHFNDMYLENRYEVNGVQYIPEDDLKALVDAYTPKFERYVERHGEHAQEMYDWAMNRFNEEGRYSLRKNGRWMPKGCDAWGTCSIHWGYGDEYRDPSF